MTCAARLNILQPLFRWRLGQFDDLAPQRYSSGPAQGAGVHDRLGQETTDRSEPKRSVEAIGMSIKTAYNQRSANTFPIAMSGDRLHAAIRDVAGYPDKRPPRDSQQKTVLQNCYSPCSSPSAIPTSSVQSIMGATLSFLLLSFIKSLLFSLKGSK